MLIKNTKTAQIVTPEAPRNSYASLPRWLSRAVKQVTKSDDHKCDDSSKMLSDPTEFVNEGKRRSNTPIMIDAEMGALKFANRFKVFKTRQPPLKTENRTRLTSALREQTPEKSFPSSGPPIQAPPSYQVVHVPPRMTDKGAVYAPPKVRVKDFRSIAGGLADCGRDYLTCVQGCFFAPVAIGQIAEASNKSGCCACMRTVPCFEPCAPCLGVAICTCIFYTSPLRKKYTGETACMTDFCRHCWCGGLARAQELRFIKEIRRLESAAAVAAPGPKRQGMVGKSITRRGGLFGDLTNRPNFRKLETLWA